MRSRVPLLALLFVLGSFAMPHFAQAAIPFFGPIIPADTAAQTNVCAAGWGMLLTVVNNIISLLITLAIVFVAPLMFAYAGFLFVANPYDPSGVSKAKGILTDTIVGILIALGSWMIVDAVMAALYNPGNSLGTWSSLITSGGYPPCLPQAGSLPTDILNPSVTTPGVTVAPNACSIAALTPLTDPLALQMEGGQTVIWTNTAPQLQVCVNKFISKVGGKVDSAYRPQEYQTHLWEIRDRWCTLRLQTSSDASCSDLKSTVSAEVTKHFGAGWACGAVGPTSRHTAGTGVDISGIDQSSSAVQQAAVASCLTWRNYPGDPYHYDLNTSCTCN